MKQNEVDCLPDGWALTTLSVTGEYINGLAFKPEDWGDSGRPIIRIQNLTDPTKPYNRTLKTFPEQFVVHNGDILVSWSATLDVFRWHGETAILNQHIFKVIPNGHVVEKSLLYYLLSYSLEQMKKSEHLHGSTMKHINRGPFISHEIALPPLAEQRRIVAEIEKQFSRLDAAVVALKRIKINLKRYRATVLRAACEGRLVPTEAELAAAEGRDYEPADVLLTRILAERRERWEADQLAKMEAQGRLPLTDAWRGKYQEPAAPFTSEFADEASKLPQLPEGWTWTNLEQSTINHDGRRVPVKASDRAGRKGPYPYYGASGIIDYVEEYLFDGEYLLIAEDGANLLSRSTPIAFRAKMLSQK